MVVKPGQAACPATLLRAMRAVRGAGVQPLPRGLPPNGILSMPIRAVACQTCEPWHPSCHGGKTPAKPHVPLCPLPAFGGQSGVKGHCPLGEGRKLADVAEAEMLQKTIRGGVKNGTA